MSKSSPPSWLPEACKKAGISYQTAYARWVSSNGEISKEELLAPPRSPMRFLGNTFDEWSDLAYQKFGIRLTADNWRTRYDYHRKRGKTDEEILAIIQRIYDRAKIDRCR